MTAEDPCGRVPWLCCRPADRGRLPGSLPRRGQLAGFLDEVAPPSGTPVLLHTEVIRQHLLAIEGPGGAWRLSGLIDFEPAMRGEREYEFAAAGVFAAEGDARFLTWMLTAYGHRRDQLGADLRRRLLAWGILRRYSNLRWWMRASLQTAQMRSARNTLRVDTCPPAGL